LIPCIWNVFKNLQSSKTNCELWKKFTNTNISIDLEETGFKSFGLNVTRYSVRIKFKIIVEENEKKISFDVFDTSQFV